MTLCAAVTARLKAEVPGLGGRVATALDFARDIARGAVAQTSPMAAVLPLGMRGGPSVAVFGAFRQAIVRRVGVILVLRAPEPAAARGAADIELLAEEVLAALAGWTPGPATPGVLRLEGAELRSLAGGLIVYDLAFALDDTHSEP